MSVLISIVLLFEPTNRIDALISESSLFFHLPIACILEGHVGHFGIAVVSVIHSLDGAAILHGLLWITCDDYAEL